MATREEKGAEVVARELDPTGVSPSSTGKAVHASTRRTSHAGDGGQVRVRPSQLSGELLVHELSVKRWIEQVHGS